MFHLKIASELNSLIPFFIFLSLICVSLAVSPLSQVPIVPCLAYLCFCLYL